MHSRVLFSLCAVALLILPTMGRSSSFDKESDDTTTRAGPLISLPTSPANGTQARGLGANDCGGRGCYYYANKTVRGNGYKFFKTSSSIACCNKCFNDSKCYAWSWGFTGNRYGQCYFFSKAQYDSSNFLYTQYYNSGFGLCNGQ